MELSEKMEKDDSLKEEMSCLHATRQSIYIQYIYIYIGASGLSIFRHIEMFRQIID